MQGFGQDITFSESETLFTYTGTFPDGTAYSFIPTDFNLDGVTDFVGRVQTSSVLVTGIGEGEYDVQYVDLISYDNQLAVTDFNGDGFPDIIEERTVRYGDGDGDFSEYDFFNLGVPAGYGDFDGDGDTDLLIQRNAFNGDFTIIGFNEEGNGIRPDTILTGYDFDDIAVGDIDGDGTLDMVGIMAFGSVGLVVARNIGRPDFTSTEFGRNSLPLAGRTLELADLDRDGDMDIVYSGLFDNLAILENTDTFATISSDILPIASPNLVRIADFNADGLPDVLSIDTDRDRVIVTVWENEDALAFSSRTTVDFGPQDQGSFPAPSFDYGTNSVFPYDVDGDGKLDIVVSANYTLPNGVRVAYNTSDIVSTRNAPLPAPFRLAPNPTDGDLRLTDLPLTTDVAYVTIYAQDGRQVGFQAYTGAPITTDGLRPGHYFLRASDADGRAYTALSFLKK